MKKQGSVLLVFGLAIAGCVGGEVSPVPTQLTLEGKVEIAEGIPVQGGGVGFSVRAVGHGDLYGLRFFGNYYGEWRSCSELNVMLNGRYTAEAGYFNAVGETSLEYSGAWGDFEDVEGCVFHAPDGAFVTFGQDMRLFISATAIPTPERCQAFCGVSDTVCQESCLAAASIDFAEVPVAVVDPASPASTEDGPGDPVVPVITGETRYVFDLIATGYSAATP